MRGDRRSSSFQKEKPAGLSRAFSWLSVSNLSRQSRHIFHSQNELHVVHNRRPSSQHPHRDRHASDESDDDDNWVYQPQHKIAVSNLDEESKWTVHYTAPWHQQENVFLPGSRPPCVEDLHRQAKVNLKSALRECDKLRKDGFRSSQYYSQGPTFSDPLQSNSSLQDEEDEDDKKVRTQSIASSPDDDQSQLSMRSQTPLAESEKGDSPEVDGQGVVWAKPAPLPTPEERMRQTAQSVPTDIVAINVTGAVFDRQASIRRSLINTDTVSRRPKKVKRRKTISGLPDNLNLELAKGRGGELRPHSMFIPGQYSTLGRVGSVNSTLRRSQTRDSSCQTEEAKVVPPSMRRIRAQRGQGIAAQLAGISASSSTGSISISSSDSSGILMLSHQHNGDPSRFHSLPRQGARVSLSADPIYSSTPIKSEEQNTLQRQIGKLQADDTVVHMRNVPRTGTLPRPKSQEVRRTRSSDWGGGQACVVSPHAAYSTSFIPNATLPSSSEVITVNTGQHSHSPSSAYPTARRLGLASSTDSLTSSPAGFTHSATCPALATSTPVHTSLEGSRGAAAPAKESGLSDNSLHSHSTLAPTPPSCQTDEQWIYDAPENVVAPHHTLTSSSSTPINQLYNSLEVSSRTTTDSSSLYSQDNDGYYTSMHLDSGLRSRSHGSGHAAGAGRATRHSMYECREMSNQDEYGSFYSDRSLARSISLRKSKKPPLPPARTDSLKRRPGPKKPLGGVSAISGNGEPNNAMLNETLIATLQQSLQMGLRPGKGKGASPSSPSHSPSSDYDDPWVLRPRSQSSISAGSSATSLATSANGMGVSNAYSLCHVTPAHSDTSSLRSDYADSWGYYMEYPRNHGDQSAQTPVAHTDNMATRPPPGEVRNGTEIDGTHQEQDAPGQQERVEVKPKTSPERVHRLTSPSSGYSSQSNTPTAGTPVPSGIRSMSPSGSRPKPKVPERKSSLISSISMSSSSTSLSSNTSDSLKSCGHPAPPPVPVTSSSAPNTPLSPPPPFPPPLPPNMNVRSPASPPPPASTLLHTPQAQTQTPPLGCAISPDFPPPPSPETLIHPSVSLNGSLSPPPPPPAPMSLTGPPPPPPLPAVVSFSSTPSAVKKAPKATVPNSPTKSPMPLITPFALQSVQLRSVRRLEEADIDQERSKAQEEGIDNPDKSHSLVLMNSCDLSPSPVSNLMEKLSLDCSTTGDTPHCLGDGKPEDGCVLLNGIEDGEEQKVLPSLFTKQKPPIIAKKPKFSFVPPPSPQPVQAEDKVVHASQPQVKEEELGEDEESLESSEPQEESSDTSTDIQSESHISAVQNASLDQEPCQNGETPDDNDDEDETSSSAGSISSKEEDAGDVFESNTAESSLNGTPEGSMVTPTPTRTRTTEDLFAAIHRSKRKVLGRRESEEDKSRSGSHSQSPPLTPTNAASPGPVSPSPRQAGSIQRHLRKSSTSSDTFKALLLKKGSRSETSFRMSAAEMLRSTDPRCQRPRSEGVSDPPGSAASPSSPPTVSSPCASPSRSKRAADEWNRYDALALSSPTSTAFPACGSKYGRSRTPPSAASSKYNARCRILSSPMTVICERDGEMAESEYGDTAESLKDSNGTLADDR
uniref:NHS-like protein 1 isoform X3 n=1 Tax=Doryrhamphus excisus TaxID=161450 RepID=UPI0025AE2243|nr:NHS-like protein 1 isoform X3 [Doryrhamphus excisus]